VDSEDVATAVALIVDPAVWREVAAEAFDLIAGRFARVEPRRTAGQLLVGLLAPIERKNPWWLAEHAGHKTPDKMQRLLREAVFDHDAARDDLRGFVAEQLGHPDGVLICDETGFLKKGMHSVGVQRQYSGTAGRTENCQLGVFLTYASPWGRTLVDRRVYLPASWCEDRDRCTGAGVPDQVEFATKSQLAQEMICAALDGGLLAGWVTGDEVYGADPELRAELQRRQVGYVLAVAANRTMQITPWLRIRADLAARGLPRDAWQRRSAGPGSKGERSYDWAWVHDHTPGPGRHSLLIRRSSDGTLAYYYCWSPHPVPLATLVRVAGARWQVEESFQLGKDQIGLDHYQCRGWIPWHRFTLLAMIALAALAVALARLRGPRAPQPDLDAELIELTVPELRRLLNQLILNPTADPAHVLAWSHWRRRLQARARRAHYKRRAAIDNDS
jgi:SRSO17 transposase